jgi:succinyl-diaminopimelate desuccinylase
MTGTNQHIGDGIDDDLGEVRRRLTALTEQLVLFRSTDSEPSERRRCLDFIRAALAGCPGTVFREFESGGYESLLITTEGCDEPDVLMCGHVDVIEHPAPDAYRPTLENGRIIGPGAGDMKGAVAIMIEVFRRACCRDLRPSLGMLLTTDEEKGGEHGVGYLFGRAGLRCGVALVPDGGGLNRMVVKEKGILHLRVSAHGKSGHAARPWLGDNAVEKLMGALARLRTHFKEELGSTEVGPHGEHWVPSCTVSMISTPNITVNRIPSTAHAALDIRFPPPFNVEGMLAAIHSILGNEIEIEVMVRSEPAEFDPDDDYLHITEEVTGEAVELEGSDGASDARFLSASGIHAIITQPTIGNSHRIDEWIDVDSMVQLFVIYERFIENRGANRLPGSDTP